MSEATQGQLIEDDGSTWREHPAEVVVPDDADRAYAQAFRTTADNETSHLPRSRQSNLINARFAQAHLERERTQREAERQADIDAVRRAREESAFELMKRTGAVLGKRTSE